MSDSQSLSRKRKYSKDSSLDTKESKASTRTSEDLKTSNKDVMNTAKRHQPSFTFKEKLLILKKLDSEPVHSVLKEFNLNDRTLRRWKKQRHEIETMCKKQNISDHKKNRPPANQELEDTLYSWFLEARTGGIPVTGPILKRKAIEINQELGGDKSFKASDGWLDNWKHRNNIRKLRITEDRRSADFVAENNCTFIKIEDDCID